jgi:hypothetical protein
MRSDTWNLRSLHRASSGMPVAKEISKYKLGAQEVRWERGGTEPEHFSMERGTRIMISYRFLLYNEETHITI